jgi:outer membrane biosynthesis protein TonB
MSGQLLPLKRRKKMKTMSKFMKWTTAYKNSLPDSSFAVVMEENGQKVRKLPFKDADGKVDVPHLRNALARLAQPRTDLSPAMRAKALKILKSYAEKYLKTYQETKSGEVIKKLMSKFESSVTDKLSSIVGLLRSMAANKKPTERISFEVKKIALLIEDLEEVVEMEKAKQVEEKQPEQKPVEKVVEPKKEEEVKIEKVEPVKEVKEEPKTEPVKVETEPAKEEAKVEDGEEESKFQELLAVCEGYKAELTSCHSQMSKMQEQLAALESEKTSLNEQVSKFKQETFTKILNETVEKVSKFRNLSHEETQKLKDHYVMSKLSESALVELGRMTEGTGTSKFEELKVTTTPSEFLQETEKTTEELDNEYSKMSSSDKLDALANLNAKINGFVTTKRR